VLPKFITFWLRGLTPGPKFTERREGLVDSEIYHPAKISLPYVNPCPRYLLPKILRTNKQTNKQTNKTVNDVSPACLLACVDNNITTMSRITTHKLQNNVWI